MKDEFGGCSMMSARCFNALGRLGQQAAGYPTIRTTSATSTAIPMAPSGGAAGGAANCGGSVHTIRLLVLRGIADAHQFRSPGCPSGSLGRNLFVQADLRDLQSSL